MGKSANPAKQAEQLRISQVGDFKNRLGGIQELPSGLIVRIKNPGGLQAFMAAGTMPNSLMGIVQKGLDTGKAPDAKVFVKDGTFDPELMDAMAELLDAIAVKVIVEPVILPKPADEADRSDEQLYADEIPTEDKQFLMQWITGGTRDLEIFRQQLDASMGTVLSDAVVGTIAQRSDGTNAG